MQTTRSTGPPTLAHVAAMRSARLQRLPRYSSAADSVRPSTPYTHSHSAPAPTIPDPVLIDVTLSQPRRLRSLALHTATPLRYRRGQPLSLPPLRIEPLRSLPLASHPPTPPAALQTQRPTQPSPANSPLSLISPKVRFSQLLPARPHRPNNASQHPPPVTRLISPPPPPNRTTNLRRLLHCVVRALDVRAMLQRRGDRRQRREDLLHQARLREIARVMGDEVERRGGRAFSSREALGVGQGSGWVDIELGFPASRVNRGARKGGMAGKIPVVKKHVDEMSGMVRWWSWWVWEWACDDAVVFWVKMMVYASLFALAVATVVEAFIWLF